MRIDRILDLAPDLLTEIWGMTSVQARLLEGGMNSATCHVVSATGRYVLKVVPHAHAPSLRHGADAARRADHPELRCGPPLPACDGRLTVSTTHGEAALLAYVDGDPLTGTSAVEQTLIGRALHDVHDRLTTPAGDPAEFFAWMRPTAAHHPVETWVTPTVTRVREAFESAPPLSWTQLHTDPAPEAFRLERDGTLGLIDWTGSMPGPGMYDLASAVMYVGGREHAAPLLESYVDRDDDVRDDVAQHLDLFLALRYAVQAAYFAQRVSEHDLTGIKAQDENWSGLHFARDRLAAAGWLIA